MAMTPHERTARCDALAWRIRLSEQRVSEALIEAFLVWKRSPLNEAAWDTLTEETATRAKRIV